MLAYGWAALLSTVILLTRQHSLPHEAFRGLMTFSFCVALVTIGWGCSAMASRLREKHEDPSSARAAERTLQAALLLFGLSVVSWLLDNYHCSRLRQLPGAKSVWTRGLLQGYSIQ